MTPPRQAYVPEVGVGPGDEEDGPHDAQARLGEARRPQGLITHRGPSVGYILPRFGPSDYLALGRCHYLVGVGRCDWRVQSRRLDVARVAIRCLTGREPGDMAGSALGG